MREVTPRSRRAAETQPRRTRDRAGGDRARDLVACARDAAIAAWRESLTRIRYRFRRITRRENKNAPPRVRVAHTARDVAASSTRRPASRARRRDSTTRARTARRARAFEREDRDRRAASSTARGARRDVRERRRRARRRPRGDGVTSTRGRAVDGDDVVAGGGGVDASGDANDERGCVATTGGSR